MSRASIVVAPLHTLSPGQYADFFALLVERAGNATRDGKPFYTCRFRDAKRIVSCMVWADSPWYEACERDWKEGQCYKLRAVYGEHERYGPQIDLHNLRMVTDADRNDGFDPSQFVDSSRFSVDEMFEELVALAKAEIRDQPLRQLVLTIYERYGRQLRELPASTKHAYTFRGGWLEHVSSLTKAVVFLADHYSTRFADMTPKLNRDLVIAGAMLHDIGRVLELSTESTVPQPTMPGKLLGYVVLGRDLVRDTSRELGNLNAELLLLLEHLMLAHLALPESALSRQPLIPEAVLLHHADNLDGQMEMSMRCLGRDHGGGPFTARDPILGKALLKHRSV
jgi:3'-5' exoribonuclease